MKTVLNNALSLGLRSDVGQLREHNEDSMFAANKTVTSIFVVADGMGGHAAGEVASNLAIQAFANAELSQPDPDALRRVVQQANAAIFAGAKNGVGKPGMGTTLTAMVVKDDTALIAQIGDSRAYIMQNGIIRQATRDHSLIEELLTSGQITEAQAAVHPNRSVITRALGLEPYVAADLYELKLHAQDRLLLCSDGLSTMLDNNRIQEILAANTDPQMAADALIAAANAAGGYDNITAIVINVDSVTAKKDAKRSKRLVRNIIAFSLIAVLLIAAAIGGIYLKARNSVFLTAEDGYVTVYKGLPGSVLGIELQWHQETTDISVASLDSITVDSLEESISFPTMQDAQDRVDEYRQRLEDSKKSEKIN